jgi:hypothetical protein
MHNVLHTEQDFYDDHGLPARVAAQNVIHGNIFRPAGHTDRAFFRNVLNGITRALDDGKKISISHLADYVLRHLSEESAFQTEPSPAL